MVNELVEMGSATINPIAHIWQNLVYYLPGLIGALIVGIIGYLIGLLFGNITEKLLIKWGLDKWVDKNDYSHVLLNIKLSKLSGQLVKWGIFIAFLAPAANLIKLTTLATILTQFALWLPGLIFAIILTAIGLILSKLVAKNIHVSKNNKISKVVAEIIQTIIIILILDVALRQIGVQIQFVETIILIIIGAVLLAIAIAIGIGLSGSIKQYSNKLMDLAVEYKNKPIVKKTTTKKKK